MVDTLFIKRHDGQPYYKVRVVDSSLEAVNLTGSSIQATFINAIDNTVVFSLDNTRINVNSAAGGLFECQWNIESGDTADAGKFLIEFTINPNTGNKFTIPAKPEEKAVVVVLEDFDNG